MLGYKGKKSLILHQGHHVEMRGVRLRLAEDTCWLLPGTSTLGVRNLATE